MAETYKILSKTAPADTAEHVLYSTSAGKEAILTNITVANRSTTDKTFDINVVDEALTDNDLTGTSGTSTVVMYQSAADQYIGSNTLKFSTDEITWTSATFPRTDFWKDFNNIGGNYIALNYNAANSVDYAVSTDAITWTLSSLPSSGSAGFSLQFNNRSIKINNTLFLLPGIDYDTYSTTDHIFKTTDGINWTSTMLPNPNSFGYATMRNLTYGNSIYFGIGSELSAYYSSTDAITWTHSTSLPVDCNFIQSHYVNGKFIAYGKDTDYNANLFFASTDAVTWTQETAPTQYGYIIKSASNGSIVLLYDDGANFYTSTDGTTWNANYPSFAMTIDSVYETDLSCNGDTFIFSIKSTGGMTTPATSYYTSTDAVTWSTVAIPDTSLFSLRFNRFNVTYNNPYSTNLIHSLYKNVTIPANTSKVLEPGIVLGSENSILIKGSSDLTFSAYGVELS